MKLPKHYQLFITHNEHHTNYESVASYIEHLKDRIDISDDDKAECIKRNEIWEIQWYPLTPTSFYYVASYSLEKCLDKIAQGDY